MSAHSTRRLADADFVLAPISGVLPTMGVAYVAKAFITVITGGASGIGLAVAQLAAEQAAVVSVMDINEQALHSAPWHTQTCDVSDANAVQQAIQNAAAALGGIDAIVNAAGIDSLGALETLPTADWERTLTINLTGPMLVCRAATPYLRASGTGTPITGSGVAEATMPGPIASGLPSAPRRDRASALTRTV